MRIYCQTTVFLHAAPLPRKHFTIHFTYIYSWTQTYIHTALFIPLLHYSMMAKHPPVLSLEMLLLLHHHNHNLFIEGKMCCATWSLLATRLVGLDPEDWRGYDVWAVRIKLGYIYYIYICWRTSEQEAKPMKAAKGLNRAKCIIIIFNGLPQDVLTGSGNEMGSVRNCIWIHLRLVIVAACSSDGAYWCWGESLWSPHSGKS